MAVRLAMHERGSVNVPMDVDVVQALTHVVQNEGMDC